jgi:hypothetical protein
MFNLIVLVSITYRIIWPSMKRKRTINLKCRLQKIDMPIFWENQFLSRRRLNSLLFHHRIIDL